jgi:hypothetical protein
MHRRTAHHCVKEGTKCLYNENLFEIEDVKEKERK